MNYHFAHLLSAPPPPLPPAHPQIPGLFGNYPKPLDTRSNRNNVLQIRNLSPSVAYAERDHLFYGLGATSVHNYPFYTIVYMANETACHSVIRLLHQRLWQSTSGSSAAEYSGTCSKTVQKRLRVEFLPPIQSESRIVNAHTVCDSSLKKLIRTTQEESFRSSISSSSSSSTLPQPNNHEYSDSCNSNFNFPPATPSVIRRIGRHLADNPRFYHHVLLLMIKLKLRPPFDEDNPHDSYSTFNDSLILEDIPLPTETLTFDRTKRKAHNDDNLLGSDESELEDDERDLGPLKNKESYQHEPKRRRVTKGLRVGLVGERILPEIKGQNISSKANPKVITTSIEEVFDSAALKPRILEIKVQRSTTESIATTSTSTTQQEKESTEEVAVPEPFGILESQPSTSKELREPKKAPPSTFDLTTLTEEELISDLDLKQNRLRAEEYTVHSAFRGYEVGERNRCLRVKNLNDRKPFAMVQRELYRLFGRFVELYNEQHLDCFNIVYMNKGRMHGQAFVTFPTEELAERALAQTHGYVMFNRPMVVSFSNSKKAIET